MTTFAQSPEREDALASARVAEFTHLSPDDLRRCIGATEVARRVARDRSDHVTVAELTRRHVRLLAELASRH